MKTKLLNLILFAVCITSFALGGVETGFATATLLVTIGDVDSYVLEVTEPCQALQFKGIHTSSTIKVDFESKLNASQNIIPEMTVYQLMSLVNGIQQRGILEKIDENDIIENFVLPFSLNGVLLFDEDNFYKVTIGSISPDSTEVHSIESAVEGSPILVKRADIKSSKTEEDFDLSTVSHLFFPNGDPSLIEHRVTDSSGKLRKVSITAEQLSLMQKENRITYFTPETFSDFDENELTINAFIDSLEHSVFNCVGIQNAILHKSGGEFIFYTVNV